MFAYIIWNIHPEFIRIGSIRAAWYGLLFAMAFLAGQYVLGKIFKIEGKTEDDLATFSFYVIIATVIGARLGHVLFYQPDYYFAHPIDIFKIWEGGLASHGAAIGILLAVYLYSRKYKVSYLWILDRLVIVVALGGCFIRLGNLMNSEIIGKPANVPFAFVFANRWLDNALETYEESYQIGYKRNYTEKTSFKDSTLNGVRLEPLLIHTYFDADKTSAQEAKQFLQMNIPVIVTNNKDVAEHLVLSPNPKFQAVENEKEIEVTWQAYGIPRHPSQLYESISSLILFVFLLILYYRYKQKTPEGLIFGLFLIILFSLRFLYEFLKENQVEGENAIQQAIQMNLGQLLSIPFVVVGVWLLVKLKTSKLKAL
ncbi:MAG: prolipoprotein diacylglyceryl transferase [Raineya sp.]|nr:prolipoprotein diacylglyceryl transferase [Raineya sp.]